MIQWSNAAEEEEEEEEEDDDEEEMENGEEDLRSKGLDHVDTTSCLFR